MVEAADIQGTYFVEFVKRIVLPRGGKSKQGKGKNGKKGSGKKEGYDLIVHIDLQEWKLSDDMVISPMFSFSLKCFFLCWQKISTKRDPLIKVAELKEVFMLFDRDEDGVLSIQELQVHLRTMIYWI